MGSLSRFLTFLNRLNRSGWESRALFSTQLTLEVPLAESVPVPESQVPSSFKLLQTFKNDKWNVQALHPQTLCTHLWRSQRSQPSLLTIGSQGKPIEKYAEGKVSSLNQIKHVLRRLGVSPRKKICSSTFLLLWWKWLKTWQAGGGVKGKMTWPQ